MSFFKFILVFIVLSAITTIAVSVMGVEFGSVSYWDRHGLFLLVFLALFPRLTLLFSSLPFGGFFWWLGFIFCPRYLIALLATLVYFHTNPILVTFAWFIALFGESKEKVFIHKRVVRDHNRVIDVEAKVIS